MRDAPLDWWSTYFDDDYLREHSPMFEPARNRAEVRRVLDLLGAPVGARILDAPCGQGRHAALLAEAGMRVTGVDYSTRLIELAKRDCPLRGGRYERGDIRTLPRKWNAQFDAVVSLGASFGFFATPAEDDATIASYARMLRPGGSLVLHAANRDGVVAHFISRDWWEADDGTLVLHEREFDPLSAVLTVHRMLRRGARSTRRAYRMRLYTATQVAELCARHGLTVTDACDGWRDRPLRRRSGEMLLRAIRL